MNDGFRGHDLVSGVAMDQERLVVNRSVHACHSEVALTAARHGFCYLIRRGCQPNDDGRNVVAANEVILCGSYAGVCARVGHDSTCYQPEHMHGRAFFGTNRADEAACCHRDVTGNIFWW